jgi:predicted nucleotidyltransferase
MNATSHDFSRHPELAPFAAVVADLGAAASPLGIAPMIAGAFARDLHLHYLHGLPIARRTEDLDFAFAVADWAAFAALRQGLLAGGAFGAVPGAPHRLRHRTGLPADLVPFGQVEKPDRTIAWPPRGEVEMDVFGFGEALAHAAEAVFAGGARARLVSLPALALLKLVCWRERHLHAPRKDAYDLQLILRNYLPAGNAGLLWDAHAAWAGEPGFDYERAGARLLGHDIRALLDDNGAGRIAGTLAEQVREDLPGLLPNEMAPHAPDQAAALLRALLQGLREG